MTTDATYLVARSGSSTPANEPEMVRSAQRLAQELLPPADGKQDYRVT